MRISFKALTSALAVPLLGIVLLTGCEGPQGPAGAIGATGADGAAGPQGPAGQDSNENCVECHDNSTLILSRQLQYMNSTHANGGHFNYGGALGASYYAGCARCHTNEGFVNHMNGDDAMLISNATPINCRGCHLVHVTGTESDLALRSDDPVTLDLTANTFDMGDGNLCANCHQARASYVIPEVGGADYEVTSEHWGVHHSPQSTMLSNVAGYEVAGSMTYPTASRHAAVADGPLEDGCVSCHMQEAHTDQAGGHTFDLWIDDTSPLTGTCAEAACHGTAADDWEDFDYDGLQTEIGDLLDDLEALLVTAGALNNTDPEDVHPVEATFSADVAGAMWNYFFVKEDQSHGVHNPQYAKALLTNSVEALTP